MSIKVVRERPSQRRHHRVTAPLFVTHGEITAQAHDWSLGGLRMEGWTGPLPVVGETIEFALRLPFQGFNIGFTASGTILRNNAETGMFALQFVDLGARESELMSHFIEELVRGSMVNIEDTIQRIDVPVTPVSTKPDPNPVAALPIRRRSLKTIAMSSFYLVAGFFIFGYVGLLGYTNFIRMEVQTAVITAPVEMVAAQVDGRVVWAGYQPGDIVPAGKIVLHVADNDLEKEIDLADLEIRRKKAGLAFTKRRQLAELARMEDYADIEVSNVRKTQLEIESITAEVTRAETDHARQTQLFEKGHTTMTRMEETTERLIIAQKRLSQKQEDLRSRIRLADRNIGSRHYTGDIVVGEVEKIEAEVFLAEHEVTLAERHYDALTEHRNRLAIRTSFDGVLRELPKLSGGAVKRGDIIAVIEQPRERMVKAYLRQDEILNVGLNDSALVYVPALGETLKARVTHIDRTRSFADEQRATQHWNGSKDRSAQVTLSFVDAHYVTTSDDYRSGVPVIAIFTNRSTNQLMHQVSKRINVLIASTLDNGGKLFATMQSMLAELSAREHGWASGLFHPARTEDQPPEPVPAVQGAKTEAKLRMNQQTNRLSPPSATAG